MQKEDKKIVGEIIRKIRKEKGLSQMQLAEKLDLSYQQIQKYEKGISNLSVERLKQIAKVLKVSINTFFPSEKMLVSDKGEVYGITPEEKELLEFFRKIKDNDIKKALIELIKKISGK